MNSPNELSPMRGADLPVARMSKKPLLLVLLMGCILAAVLIYSVNFMERGRPEVQALPVEVQPEKPFLPEDGGPGLAVQHDPPAVQAPAPVQPEKQIVVLAPQKDEAGDNARREQEQLRRLKVQENIDALRSPLVVKKGEQAQSDKAAVAATAPAGGDKPSGRGGLDGEELSALLQSDYNPAADKDKEAFFGRAKADAQWLLPDSRAPGRRFELKTGAVIPGVMLTGVNSDLPGALIAQVSQNVYDTAHGAHLLIPQGSKLYGVYDSRVVYGQSRVLVAWNRLIFPDGSAVTLGAMPGADMSGYGGFHDQVDNHYWRIFGSAVLMSLISGGTAYAMDSLNDSGAAGLSTSSSAPSMQDAMVSALSSQLGQTTTKLLEKNLNIKPTLEIRPGYRFNVIVTKDVVFEAPYAAWQ